MTKYQESPAASILVPLLDALKWKGTVNKIEEALTIGRNEMNFSDLINTMANLNFKPYKLKDKKMINLDIKRLPVLLHLKNRFYLVISREDDKLLVFDSDTRRFMNYSVHDVKGAIYSFQYVTEVENDLGNQSNLWFSKLILRFRSQFTGIAMLTMILTALDLTIPLFVILIFDQIDTLNEIRTLAILICGVVLYFSCIIIFGYYRSTLLNYVSSRIGSIISHQSFKQLLYLAPNYTETASINSQINRIKDFENIKRFITSGIFVNLVELPFIAFYILAIFVLGGGLGYIPIVTFVIVTLLSIALKPIHKIYMEQISESKTNLQQIMIDLLRHTNIIIRYGMQAHWIQRSKEANGKQLFSAYKLARFVNVTNHLVIWVTNISALLLVYGGAIKVFDKKMTLGALIGVVLLYWKVLSAIRGSSSLFVQVNGLVKSVQQINRFMKLPQDTNIKTNMVLTKALEGMIYFNEVSIRYLKTTKAALVNVSFKTKPGELFVISGHDGSGKTTILKLIMGMYIPQGGRVLIDNYNIKQLEPLSLRQSISYASDRDVVFTGTIRSNFKRLNPVIKDKEIMDICSKLGLDLYFERLNLNLDSELTETSILDLSTSFKKMFCLARTFARSVNIYLFDEPDNYIEQSELDLFLAYVNELIIDKKTVIICSNNEIILSKSANKLNLNQGRTVKIKENIICP